MDVAPTLEETGLPVGTPPRAVAEPPPAELTQGAIQNDDPPDSPTSWSRAREQALRGG